MTKVSKAIICNSFLNGFVHISNDDHALIKPLCQAKTWVTTFVKRVCRKELD